MAWALDPGAGQLEEGIPFLPLRALWGVLLSGKPFQRFLYPQGQQCTRKENFVLLQGCGCIVGRPGSRPGGGHLTGPRCGDREAPPLTLEAPPMAGRHLPSQLINFTPSTWGT